MFAIEGKKKKIMDKKVSKEDEELGTRNIPCFWNELQIYERADVIKTILGKLSCSLFRRDKIFLVEREEYHSSALGSSNQTFSLLLHGFVGYERRSVLLKLIRAFRLGLVEDILCSVTPTCLKGDEIPHCLLTPLKENPRIEAFRRWYRAYYAMRCGVFANIQERRMMTRDRLEAMIKEATAKATGNDLESMPTNLKEAQFYRNYFRHLVEEDLGSSDARFESLLEYHTATKEERVDIARIAFIVPTVIIAWSFRLPGCMTWLEENLFINESLLEIQKKTGFSVLRFVHLEEDPWLKFTQKYVTVPPRTEQKKKAEVVSNGAGVRQIVGKKGRPFASSTGKRAQIVLVNVDRDIEEARKAQEHLLSLCFGWSSSEVPMLWLWGGPDGLQSDFCMMFRTPTLPFVIGTEPFRGSGALGEKFRRPTVVFIPEPELLEPNAKPFDYLLPTSEMEVQRSHGPLVWHGLTKEERRHLGHRLIGFVEETGAPLYFSATHDAMYSIWNPRAPTSIKALRRQDRSHVVLRGMVSMRDLLKVRKELLILLTLENFEFNAQVIQHSHPLQVTLDPVTPRRQVVQICRTHTCFACLKILPVEKVSYYRCLQCSQDDGGILCESCFTITGNHPQHHLLLRIPPWSTTTPCMDLLWGPSNVFPLSRFCGKMIIHSTHAHLGVYCNYCDKIVQGIRWKCAVCYQFDSCHACFVKHSKNEVSKCTKNHIRREKGEVCTSPSSVRGSTGTHEPLHPMICIPYPPDGDSNAFLRPEVLTQEEMKNELQK